MRAAPPLALRCAPSRAWRAAAVLIGAAAGAAFAAWLAGHLELALPAAAVSIACGVAAGCAAGLAGAGPARPVDVAWDGQRWQVDGAAGDLQVMLDLDRWLLLLRHHPVAGGGAGVGGGNRWLAISFPRGAEAHRALRAALYSSPPEATSKPPPVRAPDRAAD